MYLSIVIPCLNEAESIEAVLFETLKTRDKLLQSHLLHKAEVIVVNDGSSDNSLAELKKFSSEIQIINNKRPSGYGAAIKKGIAHAQGDYIAIFDMDNTYPPYFLGSMIQKISSTHQFIVGYRQHKNSGMPIIRGFGNGLFQRLIQFLFKTSIKDPCSGMWVFNKKFVQDQIHALPDKLNFTLYLSLYLLKNKIPFAEVPIDYQIRTGESKLSPLKDGIIFLTTILKTRYERN